MSVKMQVDAFIILWKLSILELSSVKITACALESSSLNTHALPTSRCCATLQMFDESLLVFCNVKCVQLQAVDRDPLREMKETASRNT